VNLHAKFDVYISNRSRDMEGVPKFQSRLGDPIPTFEWGVAGDPTFGFLDLDLPMHHITFMELL